MNRRGFSLVELVVSMTILTILVAIFAQIFTMVSGTWSSGQAQAKNFNQARIALDVISRDIQSAVIRRDLPAFFQDGVGALTFFTKEKSLKLDGAMGTRPLASVLYEVETIDGESILSRKSRGFDYGDPISYSPTEWSIPTGQVGLRSGVGPGVLVMRYQFIGADGKNHLPAQVNGAWTESAALPGVETLRAVIVSIAVIDDEGVKLLQSTVGGLESLRQNFSTADPGPLRSYSAVWQAQMDDGTQPLATGGVPRKVLQNIRTFERTTLLPVLRKETP